MILKILVPSDGSKTAQRAAGYAVDLAKQLKASIIVLSVIDMRSPNSPDSFRIGDSKAHSRAY